jgi:hypothetical protein
MSAFPVAADFFYSFAVVNPDASVASGFVNLVVYLSDTPGALPITPIDSHLSYTAVETVTPGTYAVTFPGTDLEAYLPKNRVGRQGYIVVAQGALVLSSDAVNFTPSQVATIP